MMPTPPTMEAYSPDNPVPTNITDRVVCPQGARGYVGDHSLKIGGSFTCSIHDRAPRLIAWLQVCYQASQIHIPFEHPANIPCPIGDGIHSTRNMRERNGHILLPKRPGDGLAFSYG